MKKNKIQDCYLVLPVVLPGEVKAKSIKEKAQYVKDNMHLLSTPTSHDKVDAMLYYIENDWKGVGGECYEWIEGCYNSIKEFIQRKDESI